MINIYKILLNFTFQNFNKATVNMGSILHYYYVHFEYYLILRFYRNLTIVGCRRWFVERCEEPLEESDG